MPQANMTVMMAIYAFLEKINYYVKIDPKYPEEILIHLGKNHKAYLGHFENTIFDLYVEDYEDILDTAFDAADPKFFTTLENVLDKWDTWLLNRWQR